MVGDLAKVGIKANLNYGKYAAIRDAIRSGKSQMAFMTWGSNSIGDISASTGVFFEGDAEDTYNDAEVKADMVKGDSLTDPAARKAAYSKALHRSTDERRVGKECVRKCRTGWTRKHQQTSTSTKEGENKRQRKTQK